MKLKRAVVALSAAIVILSGAAQAVPRYSVTDLGTLGGASGYASAINASGQVVGSSSTAGDNSHAFLYSGGAMTDLGTLDDGMYSSATDINASGQVVGWGDAGDNPNRAFLYSGGAMTDLGTLGGNSGATGINARGQVVGWFHPAGNNTNPHAFLYSGGVMTDLGLGDQYSFATDINANGQVVGIATTATGQQHAFLYSGGVMTDIGTILGGQSSVATGINDNGEVVGVYYNHSNDIPRAFLYTAGTMIDLGISFYPSAINASGQIVGYATRAGDDPSHAILYSEGKITDLNSLIDLRLDGRIDAATSINDSGQIAAYDCGSGNCRAFLLSPVPEPEIYLMMLAGLGLVGMKMRRRNSI